MKVMFKGFSRLPLGRHVSAILEVLREHSWAIDEIALLSRQRRTDLDEQSIVESAYQSSSDLLEIRGKGLRVNCHWLYGPRARYFSQSLSGSLAIEGPHVGGQLAMIEQLFERVGVFYGQCDSEKQILEDVDLSSRSGDPTLYLLRPYWLIYLGTEYEQMIPRASLESVGVEIRKGPAGGSSLIFFRSPEGPDRIFQEAVMTAWPVFLTSSSPGKFKAPVVLDLTEIQKMAPPMRRRETSATLVGDEDEFILAVPRRREAALTWAREHGSEITSVLDFVRIVRKFEAQIMDERELELNFIALYGELIREDCSGSWSKGSLLARGEPTICYGLWGLLRRRVVREFLELF